jgi:pimeloyl-ACP methyl ester carboxylesterase
MSRRPLTVIVAAALVLAAVAPSTADARRSDNRKKPVLFVHGLDFAGAAGYDCGSYWGRTIRRFRDFGHTGRMVTIAYYGGDRNCTHWLGHHGRHSRNDGHRGRAHDADTSIRHLGYHLAWTIWNHYSRRGKRVDLVGHSMGGLVIRYALARTVRNDDRFPPYLLVEDAVTLGTPHDGTHAGILCAWLTQCVQMGPNSGLMNWLRREAMNPQGRGGTDWSVFSSYDDLVVSEGSGVHMNAAHRVVYLSSSNVSHDDFRLIGSARITADVRRYSRAGGWVTDRTSHWPIRRADLAVTFGNR